MSSAPADPPLQKPRKKKYRKAVTPGLKRLLWVVFALFAVLGANSLYLATITALEAATGETYQDFFYQYMFLAHLVLGLAIVLPVIAFGLWHIRNTYNRPNRRAVIAGYSLFVVSLILLASGAVLMRIDNFFEVRDPTVRSVLVLGPRDLAPGGGVALRPAPPGGAPDQVEGGGRLAGGRRGLRVGDGGAPVPGPAAVERHRTGLRRAVLLPLLGPHVDGELHPGRDADDGPVLRRVSRRRARVLVPQRSQVQLVQQPGLPVLRPRDAGRDDGA